MRLWLNSSTVLQAMLTHSTRLRSSMVREELEDNLRTFVPNEGFPRAIDLLRQRHVCIIAGIPGVGKTTLAQALVAAYVHDGYELVDVGQDIEQALATWNDGQPQVFYYDDFLGQTTLDDKLGKNEDVRLINFLRKVERSANKRIVLTTREYILEHARQRYERLASADFDPLTCVIDMGDYSDIVRAQVLYNHLYFANLTDTQLAEFVDPSRHRALLEHPNFSPRLISLTLANTVTPTGSAFQALRSGLDHPYKLWKHIIRYQLDEHQVILLEVLYCLSSATVESLGRGWMAICQARGIPTGGQRFRNTLEVLEGTLVRVRGTRRDPMISFANPSIRDYLEQYIAQQPDVLDSLIQCAVFFEQAQTLWITYRSAHPASVTDPPEQLGQRLHELLNCPPLVGTLSEVLPDRYATLLQVAETLGPRSLADEVLGQLFNDTDSVIRGCENLDSLVALVEVVSQSELVAEEYPYGEDELGAAVLQQIEESACDWDTAVAARSALSALEHHYWFDAGIAERVEEIVREAALDLIEAWQAGDEAARERTDMYEVLEHADMRLVQDDNGHLYSPVEAFSNYLHLIGDHAHFGPAPRRAGSDQNRHWDDIARLFARFAHRASG